MTDAELLVDGAMAELSRARGLFRGPLTAAKKTLLLARLTQARADLQRGWLALARERPVSDPLSWAPASPTQDRRGAAPPAGAARERDPTPVALPTPSPATNLIDLRERRSRTRRPF